MFTLLYKIMAQHLVIISKFQIVFSRGLKSGMFLSYIQFLIRKLWIRLSIHLCILQFMMIGLFGRRKIMVSILSAAHIACVCKNYSMLIILRHKFHGPWFGSLKCRQRLRTSFGVFVVAPYLHGCVLEIKELIVKGYVHYVIWWKKTAFTYSFDAQAVATYGACVSLLLPLIMCCTGKCYCQHYFPAAACVK